MSSGSVMAAWSFSQQTYLHRWPTMTADIIPPGVGTVGISLGTYCTYAYCNQAWPKSIMRAGGITALGGSDVVQTEDADLDALSTFWDAW